MKTRIACSWFMVCGKDGIGRMHAPAKIDRCVLLRVTGKAVSRLWEAGRLQTLKKRRGIDEISFKEAANGEGAGAAHARDERLRGVVRHLKKSS
ncbi:hypothetical protein [Burkholderia lata]|uniref:hypothetical protein n=1 Tax=Burkholderia lata (strain ATCC 17760 / DSM 23089 / LMG 22485 / NCIMB 9086 / R18194 / 383) TaxID=482957 RepID=UPI0015826B61|nr:hypothetical protein [Burkholderia lata]